MSLDWRYVANQGTSLNSRVIHRGVDVAPIPLRADLALTYSTTKRVAVDGTILPDIDEPYCGRFSNILHFSLFWTPIGHADLLQNVFYRRLNRVQFNALSWSGIPAANDPYPWPQLALRDVSERDLCTWHTWEQVDGVQRPDHDGIPGYHEILSYLETYSEWMEAIPFTEAKGLQNNHTFWMDVDWEKATGSDEPPGEGPDYGFLLEKDFGIHLVADRGYDP